MPNSSNIYPISAFFFYIIQSHYNGAVHWVARTSFCLFRLSSLLTSKGKTTKTKATQQKNNMQQYLHFCVFHTYIRVTHMDGIHSFMWQKDTYCKKENVHDI